MSRLHRDEVDAPVPSPRGKGQPAVSRRLFSGLLRCHCGDTLSSMPRGSDRNVGYYCKRAHVDREPPGPYVVSERFVLEALRPIIDETIGTPRKGGRKPDEEARQARLAHLEQKRLSIIDAALEGLITKPQRDERLVKVAKEKEALERVGVRTVTFRAEAPFDWSAPVGEQNARLRAVWEAIILERRDGRRPGAQRGRVTDRPGSDAHLVVGRILWWIGPDWGQDGPGGSDPRRLDLDTGEIVTTSKRGKRS